ncbi:PREDICTED: histone-lysine N-methyltransferase SETMAR-like [Polistes dominula]|uniref:Histone-lysine N-methyltransferase SETMAR-like n=1 Tax=Polistes dominula TaxID=743375 RepID=A0ABM1JBG3_POLDO|nr:PREDICTED: histone-lysine N-methyltransferase SETMAR-like [Polistes dominula]
MWVPKELIETVLVQRRTICASLCSRHEADSFLQLLIIADEKRNVCKNSVQEKQLLSLGEASVSRPEPSLTIQKILVCVWWDTFGIIHYELLEPGQTVTATTYCEQLERMKQELIKKGSVLVNGENRIFQQDNAGRNAAEIVQKKITELGLDLLPYPPYSADLLPSKGLFYLLEL